MSNYTLVLITNDIQIISKNQSLTITEVKKYSKQQYIFDIIQIVVENPFTK